MGKLFTFTDVFIVFIILIFLLISSYLIYHYILK